MEQPGWFNNDRVDAREVVVCLHSGKCPLGRERCSHATAHRENSECSKCEAQPQVCMPSYLFKQVTVTP